MFDCVVVGAGPAGCSAAYHLARRGHAVLILEKAALPRHKPCSGALSPLVAQWFDFDWEPAIARKLRRVRYTWKLADAVTAELQTQDPIWIVQRDKFDFFLAQQAIAQGAELQDQTPVIGIEWQSQGWQINTATGAVQGRYLVAADGAAGPTAQWLGLQGAKLRTGAILEVPMTGARPDMEALNFEFGLLKQGCLWCFPQSHNYVLGAVTFLGKSLPDYGPVLAEYATAFGLQTSGQLYTQALKLWEGHYPLHTQQAVVVGEAAAIVDPLSAEGIRHGLYSGVAAAEAIHAALQGTPEALAGYTKAMQAWGENMQWAQRIASVFFRVPGIGYRVGIKRPTMTARMGQLLAGEIQYSDIANRILKRLSTGLIPGRK
jgi:geranylgeranyl reductase family protein